VAGINLKLCPEAPEPASVSQAVGTTPDSALLLIGLFKLAALALWPLGIPWVWVCVLFLGPDLWLLYHLFIPSASGIVRTFTRFETTHSEVWLTIDDGPDEHDTPRILDLLDRHEARATFFLIGEHAARSPDLVAEIARRGHEIGHHTHTHRRGTFWCATPRQVNNELDTALPSLTPPDGPRPRRFRAPVGIKNLFLAKALARRNLRCVGWTVRSLDSLARNPEKIAARVLRQVRPGTILLMHEGSSLHAKVRVNALERVLDGLSARGLRCVIPANEQLK
jgi:peptidoglycan/xylan/chitin deacetylase (PgdA/CDA1 family)